MSAYDLRVWWAQTDLNCRPTDYESAIQREENQQPIKYIYQ